MSISEWPRRIALVKVATKAESILRALPTREGVEGLAGSSPAKT